VNPDDDLVWQYDLGPNVTMGFDAWIADRTPEEGVGARAYFVQDPLVMTYEAGGHTYAHYPNEPVIDLSTYASVIDNYIAEVRQAAGMRHRTPRPDYIDAEVVSVVDWPAGQPAQRQLDAS
jgi:hypothetical protein